MREAATASDTTLQLQLSMYQSVRWLGPLNISQLHDRLDPNTGKVNIQMLHK